MQILRLIPATFSCLLIAAHFQRAGTPSVAILCLFLPALLLIPRRLSIRVMQLLLVCFALEWLPSDKVRLRADYDRTEDNAEPVGLTRTPHEPPRWMKIPVGRLSSVISRAASTMGRGRTCNGGAGRRF